MVKVIIAFAVGLFVGFVTAVFAIAITSAGK